ncbi:hypothetical protein OKZ62_001872 [Vibrio navarrensis]|nr:hypothetical protein [Vibrio navarrensis]
MPVNKADSGYLGYGLSKGKSGYKASVPTVDGGYRANTFLSLQKAKNWQIVQARREWGLDRFQLIKRGLLATMRKKNHGVTIRYIAKNREWGVFWREKKQKKSKYFSQKRYGEYAEAHANWFAAKQRAKLTGGELNLPEHLTPEMFELNNSVKINAKKDGYHG